jgi:hypothetical protein
MIIIISLCYSSLINLHLHSVIWERERKQGARVKTGAEGTFSKVPSLGVNLRAFFI